MQLSQPQRSDVRCVRGCNFSLGKKERGGKGEWGKGISRSSHDHYNLLLLLLGLILQLPSPFRLKDSLAQFSQEGGGLLWNDSGLWRPVPPHFPPPPGPISTTTQQSSSSTVAANFSLVPPPPPFLFKRKRAFDFPLLYFLSRVSAVF